MNYEEAKKMLSNSSKAGKIIHLGNNEWGVEYLPEREIEYKKHMKQRQDAALERKKKEKEENESNEKRLKNIQKMKKRE